MKTDDRAEARRSTENPAYALRARAPEMPPNSHQQPTIARARRAQLDRVSSIQGTLLHRVVTVKVCGRTAANRLAPVAREACCFAVRPV